MRNTMIPALMALTVLAGGVAVERVCAEEAAREPFTFALIGDIPRFGDKQVEPDLLPFKRLRDEINASGVAFVVHDGDFKSGASPCSDEEFQRWHRLTATFDAPFFFICGDNEWTDCHRPDAGGFDPVERLDMLRKLFYSQPRSLGGTTMPMVRQSDVADAGPCRKYSDNFLWEYGDIMFVGLNVQGSNNNLGRTAEMDGEFRERNDAVNAFLHYTFERAKKNGSLAVVIVIQANPRFENRGGGAQPDGYSDFRRVLEEETIAFGGRPVVLVHGDSHYFRIDKPMVASTSGRRVEYFTRVETFGTPDVHWIRATVDYDKPGLFLFEPMIVRDNIIEH